MPISNIDTETCIGCGTCVLSCPCDVVRLDEETGKSSIVYKEDCQTCNICVHFCPVEGTITISSGSCERPMVGWG